jgi:elongation factor G
MASFGTGETRVIAVVGPYHSGKTALVESLMVVTGGLARKGAPGSRLMGDSSAEAKARAMGVELNAAPVDYMGEHFVFLDCPGSAEFMADAASVIPAVDAVIVVCEPDAARMAALSPLFHLIEAHNLPRFVVFNKIDKASGSIREAAEALARVSSAPVILRHIPVREGDRITGYVDLAAERAYVYKPGSPSQLIDMPGNVSGRFLADRGAMLERLADFDDHLMEELLENITPSHEEIYKDLAIDVQDGKIVPIFMASATLDEGSRRLLKALRHELPAFAKTKARLGVGDSGSAAALVVKTLHTAHGGKLSVSRVMRGSFKDGDSANGARIAGVWKLVGTTPEKLGEAKAGDIAALGKLDPVMTGDGIGMAAPARSAAPPVYELAIVLANRNDDVKLSGAIAKLTDEDPSLHFVHDHGTGEMKLRGQGEVHLTVAMEKLKSRYGLSVSTMRPQTAYLETIRKGTRHQARHKKQSGGHGQFGDVTIEVRPLDAGEGFLFKDAITGGAVPRQYIPSVQEGVESALKRGPLGFPVVDLEVTLVDGKYHTVDSSDMAFQTAGRMAISEALPACQPVLLEPVNHVRIHVPNDSTSKANQVISSRRGQILGFDARDGWNGWDTVEAHIPQAELHDLIIELRSLTEGAGTYDSKFDHMAELSGRMADQVVKHRHAAE